VVEKTEILKDGTQVNLREMHLDDLDRLMVFFRALAPADRRYLRLDVTDREAVAQRLKMLETGEAVRIIAMHGNEVAAEGVLEISGEMWGQHQGEIRVIVGQPFRQKGLGTTLIRELYFAAVQRNLESIVARMMRPQVEAEKIFRRLGFRELLMPDFVKDLEGGSQDLIIMTCSVRDLAKELDHLMTSDWQRCR